MDAFFPSTPSNNFSYKLQPSFIKAGKNNVISQVVTCTSTSRFVYPPTPSKSVQSVEEEPPSEDEGEVDVDSEEDDSDDEDQIPSQMGGLQRSASSNKMRALFSRLVSLFPVLKIYL